MFALASDTARGRVVLFGGDDLTQVLGDTWEWDGTAWAQTGVPGAGSPAARSRHALAFDAARGVTLLHAGTTRFQLLDDTWLWNGAAWQQAPAAAGTPGPRVDTALAFDATRNVVVLFGGQVAAAVPDRNDLWEWDGLRWTQRFQTTPPQPRYFHDLVYDPDRRRMVLHGGSGGLTVRDTWEWDGASTWRQTTGTPAPGTGSASDAIWDPVRRRLLLFDGLAAWVYSPSLAAASVYGNGCAGTLGVPRLSAAGRPFLGSPSFGCELTAAAANAACLLAIDVSAAAASLPGGCTLLLQQPRAWSVTAAARGGAAWFAAPVPASAPLKGLVVFAQAAVLDPAGAFAGIALSNGVRLLIAD
jgi:hypothetical protein